MGAGSPALPLLSQAVDKLAKMREWHNQRSGGNANGNHRCAGELIGQSIMRRRPAKWFIDGIGYRRRSKPASDNHRFAVLTGHFGLRGPLYPA